MFISRKRLRELESRIEYLEKLRVEDRQKIADVEMSLCRFTSLLGYRRVYIPPTHEHFVFEKIPPAHRDG